MAKGNLNTQFYVYAYVHASNYNLNKGNIIRPWASWMTS